MDEGGKVLPGDYLATCEEYIPGDGTYELEGRIFASKIGTVRFDDTEKIASVFFSGKTVLPEVGDVVLGRVLDVRTKTASISVAALEKNGRGLPDDDRTMLHITRMSVDFIDNPRRYFRPGDIIRARIAQVSPNVQLSTAGEGLGVLRAFCGKCHLPLERKGSELYCSECDRSESRELSGYYGLSIQPGESNNRSADNGV